MRKIAIIDTGSNTIRLVVFVAPSSAKNSSKTSKNENNTLPNYKFRQIVNMKKTAGLSNYVVSTGDASSKNNEFSSAGVEKASRVLAQLLECANNLDCSEIYIFATAVLRNVLNSASAVKEIESCVGKNIELLSGNDEAMLGFLGAFSGKQVNSDTYLIDLGGGSCEITRCGAQVNLSNNSELANLPNYLQTTSLKIGCVSAYSRFVSRVFPDRAECAKIRDAVKGELATLGAGLFPKSGDISNRDIASNDINNNNTNNDIEINACGIGGSIRAIAKIMREVSNFQKTPKTICKSDIEDILNLLHADPSSFAHTVVRAVPDRIHSVIPGCLVILEVMDAIGISRVNICKKGVREGFLLSKV